MTRVQFSAADHTYTLDGVRVPSVTQILQSLPNEYAMVDPDVLERAAEIGRKVHGMIEDDVHGRVEIESYDAGLLPYLDMWREFLCASGFRVIASEQIVYSLRYRYAGTLDLFGRLNDRYALIDTKRTAAVPRKAGPQTAGYKTALQECCPEYADVEIDRFALHLTPERWRLVPFTDRADARVFLAAHTINQWSNAK